MTHIEQMIKDMCPYGVEYKRLGEVTRTLPKGTLKTTDLTEEGFPVINSGKSLYGYYSEYNNDCQAVTIAARGEYAGWISYFNEKFWAGGLCYPYTSKDEKVLMTRFLYFWLKREEGTIMDTLVARGSIPALNKSDLDQLEIPIPPLEIQQKIVECLDKFSALAAELQAELQMRRKQYEYYRTLLLTPHSDGNSADNTDDAQWEWKTLGEICELVTKQTGFDYSNTIKPALLDKPAEDTVPFLQTRNFSGRDFDYNTEYYVPNKIVEQFPRIVLDKECLLLSIVGASIGNVGLFPGTTKCFLGGAICVLKFKEGVNIPYIYEYLSSCYGQKMIRGKIKGAGQATITIEDIRNFAIPFPSQEKQEYIATLLGKFGSLVDDLSDGIPAEQAAQQKRYEYYRDLLLTFPRKTV